MQVLLLSIMAKCGVYTHVKDLATHLKNIGFSPLIGLISNSTAINMFRVSKKDSIAMEQSLNGIPYFYYDSNASLFEIVKDMEIDIVHAHSPLVLEHGVYLKDRMNLPFVVTLHGAINWNKHYSTELKMADKIIAIGPEVANSCGSGFADKLRIIFNGIDTDYFKPNENKTANQTLRILWTGRTSGAAARGAESLSMSLNILKKMGIPYEAKLIGFPFGANVRGIEDCGWVHDPRPLLQWSDIAFGRGRSLREAMACGNAGFLLAEGYGSLVYSKWFEDGKQPQLSGSLKHGYSELNSKLIAKDIMYFYKHRDRLEFVKRHARLIAEEYFDIKKMVDETIRVYEEAAISIAKSS